jgi:adenylate cyclase
MRIRLHSPLPVIAASLLALGALLSLVRQAGYLEFLELAAYDLLVASVANAPPTTPALTLILIDEADIQRLGNWPLTDAQLHGVLEDILGLGPLAVGLDIYRDLEVPPGHADLQTLLRNDPRIIAIEKFPAADSPGIAAPPALRGSARVGFADLVSDPGGVVRRNLLFQSDAQRTGYSLALQLALAYLGERGIHPAPGEEDPTHMRLGPVTFVPLEVNAGGYVDADAGGYQVMLAYRDTPLPFPAYSLADLSQGAVPAAQLRDRLVILGVAADSVKDFFVSPFAIVDQAGGTLSGSTVHAHAAQQLIDAALAGREPLRFWSDRGELAWLWLWTALGLVAGWFAGPSWRFALVVGGGAAAAVALAVSAYADGWWIPVVPNLAGWLLAAALGSAVLAAHRRRDQQVLMSLFSRSVSPEVAHTIWQRRDEVLVDGRVPPRTQTVTTLFTDLQGFTQVSEQMEPEPFLLWLNSYLGELTDIIMQHGGVLDDYAGDGIKASFGIPFCEPGQVAEQAQRAVRCALALGDVLTRLNTRWQAAGHACMAMRVGLHTGPVVVGTVGSPSRMKYTTVGRNVNLASRLECLKDFPCPDPNDECNNCRILISEDTAALVADAFDMLDAGSYALKGISEKIRVFAIIRAKSEEQGYAQVQS